MPAATVRTSSAFASIPVFTGGRDKVGRHGVDLGPDHLSGDGVHGVHT